MLHYTFLKLFAQAYGAGSYGSSTYSNGNTTAGGGSLSNTGIAIALIVTIAALTLLVAMVVRIMRRPSRQQAPEVAENDDSQNASR